MHPQQLDLGGRLAEIQRRYFEDADAARFHWTTSVEGIAEAEDELLAPLLEFVEGPCLEIGCGEGNNLARLLRKTRCVGVDLFPKKLIFAARELPQAQLAGAEASELPFRDGVFATVFMRDLLHHVPNPTAVLAEAVRVLRAGGLLCLLEPNGRNPLVRLQTHLVRAEIGARKSGVDLIVRLLEALPLSDAQIRTRQPLPLQRLVLHYRFGFPSIGRRAVPRRVLTAMEAIVGKLVPPSRWAYVVATARRAGG
jgi:SAM-dependent methyltransferase